MNKNIDSLEKIIKVFDWLIYRKNSIIHFIKNNYYKVNTRELSKIEQNIILKFYDNNLGEYTLNSISISENNNNIGAILKLVNRKILNNQTLLDKINNYDGNGVRYTLTKRAYKKLNKLLKNQKKL